MTMQVIEHIELASDAASITFSSISGDFTDLYLVFSTRTATGGAAGVDVTLNGSTSGFSARYLRGDGSSASSSTFARYIGSSSGSTDTANTYATSQAYFPNYAGSSNKSYSADTVTENNGTTAYQNIIAGLWSNTTAITSIGISNNGGANFTAGSSATLFGITAGSDGTTTVS